MVCYFNERDFFTKLCAFQMIDLMPATGSGVAGNGDRSLVPTFFVAIHKAKGVGLRFFKNNMKQKSFCPCCVGVKSQRPAYKINFGIRGDLQRPFSRFISRGAADKNGFWWRVCNPVSEQEGVSNLPHKVNNRRNDFIF